MNMDLDEALGRLSIAPMPPGLAEIEDKVFARVREEAAFAVHRLRIGMVAAIAALGLGVAAGSPVTAAASPNTLSPFGPSSPLAPSTLLAAD